jgi:murein DD-endopeptidase MepM/ murein hydrolase activator NlpD
MREFILKRDTKKLVLLIALAVLCLEGQSLSASAQTSEQPQLKAPWRGRKKISQGNHGPVSHNVCGQRTLQPKNCNWENTYALDIPMDRGTEVLAPADGDVVYVDNDPAGSAGRELGLECEGPTGKKFVVLFGHLKEILISSGHVLQGTVLAKSGASSDGLEEGTSYHLHVHIWAGSGARDSHTIPIERLVLSDGSGFREYDASVVSHK